MKKTLALLLLLAGLSVEAQAKTLTWNGGSMEWNTTDDNWLQDETAAKYTNEADVVFGNTGCGRVTLVGSFAPKSVLVENTPGHTYFFNGNGNLTGAMQLTKDGEGLLFIYTANDYTGGTVIKGGTLQMVNENALGSEDVTLMGGTLNLGEHTLSNNVNVNGSGHIANGTVSGNLSLADNASFTWEEGSFLELTGSITLGNNTTLDLGKHTLSQNVILNGYDTYIGNGSINHDLAVERGALYLAGNIGGRGNIIVGSNAKLSLAGYTLSNNVILNGGAQITGSGTISGNLILADNASFFWNGSSIYDNVQLTGSVTLENDASLELNGQTLSASVNVIENRAIIRGGTLSGDLTIGAGNTLDLYGDLTGSGVISLEDGAELNWTGQTLSGSIKLGRGSRIRAWLVSSITNIQAIQARGLLEKVSVSEGLIAGTDRQTSLADGLYIESDANLMIKSMTITANNEIHVDEHTITLKDVTIKLSEDYFDRENPVDGVYYFKLQDLFHCDVEFNNVVFDATDLTLPQGFDPSKDAIGLDFGNEVNIAKTDSMYLHMGGDWSQTMSLVDGKPVFTALVPTPEPTTGTLGLLALAALCMRKRRK